MDIIVGIVERLPPDKLFLATLATTGYAYLVVTCIRLDLRDAKKRREDSIGKSPHKKG